MGVFNGCTVAFELSTTLSFKEKQCLRSLVKDEGGVISYILTKKVSQQLFMVTYLNIKLFQFIIDAYSEC